jgi:hypothetical protein
MEQMTGLETLHQEVEKSLEHIRSESEHLVRTDEMIRRQRSILQSTFRELEQKQMLLQEKGELPSFSPVSFQIIDNFE